jgi:hypothetical protein
MTIVRAWEVPWDSDPGQTIKYAELQLNMGHTEYSFPLDEFDFSFYSADEDDQPEMKPLTELPRPQGIDPDDWGTYLVFSGTRYHLKNAFVHLAAQLMPCLDPMGYRPGGDDDYFDYWPSGMEALKAFAKDLDQLFQDTTSIKFNFTKIYFLVLQDFLVREVRLYSDDLERGGLNWEHVPEYVGELAEYLDKTINYTVTYIKRLAATMEI